MGVYVFIILEDVFSRFDVVMLGVYDFCFFVNCSFGVFCEESVWF